MDSKYLSAANRGLALLKSASTSRDHAAQIEVIRDFSDIATLPPTNEQTFRECVQTILDAKTELSSGYTFMSSGTTGSAKFGIYPRDLLIPEISDAWNLDLKPGHRFMDLSGGGSGWSLGHFFRELALHNGQNFFHLGPAAVSEDFDALWASFLEEMRPSTISGNATLLGVLAERILQRGPPLESITSIFWSAEPMRQRHHRIIAEAFPKAGIWSCYGSTETWVIGVRQSEQPLNHYRILPYQYLEPQANGTWVTSLHPNSKVPVLRYEMADIVNVLETRADGFPCRIEVLGRSDKQMFFSGKNLSPEAILAAVKSLPSVEDAQLVVSRDDDVISGIELRYIPCTGTQAITKEELESVIVRADSQNAVLRGLIAYNDSKDFEVNSRTGKCPNIFYR